MVISSANLAWYSALNDIQLYGCRVTSRGMRTLELLNHTVVFQLDSPVLQVPNRKINYQFMAAEALWILNGDNSVAGIVPYLKKLEQYSDDGETFFGAYGPPVVSQLDYCINALKLDKGTRQSVLTIWRQNPPVSKDIPCTLSIQFIIRHDRLNLIVTMRSNDAWLGLPYDMFTFAMIGWHVMISLKDYGNIEPGLVYITAGSRHVYQQDEDKMVDILVKPKEDGGFKSISLYEFKSPDHLKDALRSRVACPKDQPFTQFP